MTELPIRQSGTPGKINVIRATPRDADSIARILDAAFAAYKSQYTAEGYRATVLSTSEIVKRLDEGPTWVAIGNADLIGTVSAVVRSDGLYVRSMAVSPVARGRGIAWALLGTVELFARQTGATAMYLSTTPFLTAAIGLYEK